MQGTKHATLYQYGKHTSYITWFKGTFSKGLNIQYELD